MAASVTRWIDGAVGETREIVSINGVASMVRIVRWSDAGRFARWGETYAGRVRSVDRRLRGAFVDLGQDLDGFLRIRGDGSADVAVGAYILVGIAREAARDKGPVLDLLGPTDADRPHRRSIPECDEDLDGAPPAAPDVRERIDAIIERALDRHVPLAGGGSLSIEPTSALVAVDVDAGARAGSSDPERFALALNLDAARAVMRELKLRSLGGLAAIDFVSMRAPPNRKAVEKELAAAALDDPWSVVIAPMSRFGVVELSRAQLRAPLHERLCGPDGRKSAETVALEALRAIERESRAGRGRFVMAHLAPEVARWLNGAAIPWRESLSARIGVNWAIEERPSAPRDLIDVETGR
jgi:Ribonuclease G/E